jgi:glutamine amidotransferase
VNGPLIAVLDYGMGNRRSVQKALAHAGARVELTADRDILLAAEGIVIPGVGAFPLAMRRLQESALDQLILQRARAGVPLLGICLGMQLLFERSEEIQPTAGLGLIGGEVRRLRAGGLRVPHIGWSEVSFERRHWLIDGLGQSGCPFYHVHSYAAHPDDPQDVLASACYGERFATAVAHENILGVQFHPEKSSRDGLRLLSNFVASCAAQAAA